MLNKYRFWMHIVDHRGDFYEGVTDIKAHNLEEAIYFFKQNRHDVTTKPKTLAPLGADCKFLVKPLDPDPVDLLPSTTESKEP